MRKVLVALFAIIILGIGFVGYSGAIDEPVEVIDENDHSTKIKL